MWKEKGMVGLGVICGGKRRSYYTWMMMNGGPVYTISMSEYS